MSQELSVLAITAASIGFFHTLLGPDHYLPFIVMSKARKWSLIKTGVITLLCGFGHIASSIVLGIIGVALGIAVGKLEGTEAVRGDIASWLLIAFGLAYFVWGLRRALKNRPHKHLHVHADGSSHAHDHSHGSDHGHVHEEEARVSITPWILFTIFVLGPCEPLIPVLMYPAAKGSIYGLVLVTAIFGSITLATMLVVVLAASLGVNFLPLGKLERYAHALAGGAIFASGMAVQFLGL